MVEAFLKKIQEMIARREHEEKLVLKLNKDEKFSVRFYYSSLVIVLVDPFLVKEFWSSYANLKVDFFAWDVVWGKIMTLSQLRRGRAIANWCCLCFLLLFLTLWQSLYTSCVLGSAPFFIGAFNKLLFFLLKNRFLSRPYFDLYIFGEREPGTSSFLLRWCSLFGW